jgi:ketosteroid isomerase-like protein
MKTLISILALILLIGCSPKKFDTKVYCDELMQADRDFSSYSIQHGKNAAFLKFAAEDVTFLSENTYPMVGIKQLEDRQAKRSDSTYVLTWEPMYARASQSGDLGYTYGTWKLKIKADTTKNGEGTYVTFWQRQPNGEWKYVLDTGHEGLGEKK